MFSPLDPSFSEHANEVFKEMRSMAPVSVHGNEKWTFLSIFMYRDIVSALGDHELWSSDIPEVADLVLGDAALMIQDDPPEHSRFRRNVFPFINRKAVIDSEIEIDNYVERILKEHVDCDIEFQETIAAALSSRVICELLGLEPDCQTYIRDWTNKLANNVGAEFLETDERVLNEQKLRVRELHSEMTEFLTQQRCKIIKRNSDRGLISHLASTNLDLEHQIGLAKSAAFAGNHSSAILITNAIWLFAMNPRELEKLRSRPELIPSATEEILRYKGTFRGVQRVASRDGHIHGTEFKKGDYLLAWTTSGNFDESEFQNPECFDIDRKPNRQLSLGYGCHYCVGSQLARLEMYSVLKYMVKCVQKIEILQKPTPIDDPWVDGFMDLRVKLCTNIT